MHYGYLLRGTVTGLWKVGISGNVKRRIAQYKTHTPERITLEAVKEFYCEEEARDWEYILLRQFELDIEHGEWIRTGFAEMAEAWTQGSYGREIPFIPRGENGPRQLPFIVCRSTPFSENLLRVLRFDTVDEAEEFLRQSEDGGIPRWVPRVGSLDWLATDDGKYSRKEFIASLHAPSAKVEEQK
jgi:hypothetical protein